jgi:hypothetical protein
MLVGLLIYNAEITIAQEADNLNNIHHSATITKATFYVEAGTHGTKRESDPPEYVSDLRQMGFLKENNKNWLLAGLDYRTRFEVRNNDIRRPKSFNEDYPFLLRTRAYFGIKELIDPFRLVLEMEDARQVNGNYPLNNRKMNAFELIQGYGELFFKNALGKDMLGNNRPLIIRGGRMAFEFLDRRLIALNAWRNTTNNFLGGRVTLGQDNNDWQIDMIANRPITRLIDKFDQRNKEQFFYGAIGHWRRWSHIVTIEPYYLGFRQQATAENNYRYRFIHNSGLRFYGWLSPAVNYDFTASYQTGEDHKLQHRAYAFTADIGYIATALKSRLRFAVFFGYVSGDQSPDDSINHRFERLFGFSRPWSAEDYMVMENIIAPKLRMDFQLPKGVRIDGGYNWFWLASAKDRYVVLMEGNAFSRDDTGNSGRFIGHGLDVRARFKPVAFINAVVGYNHFTHGDFIKNRQYAANGNFSKSSDFAYMELTLNFFDAVKFFRKQ